MQKTVLRLNILNRRFHLSHRTMPLLLVLLLITLSTQLTSHADTDQLLFRGDDLKDPGSLAVKLQDRRAALSEVIVPQLSAETQRLLDRYDGISNPSTALQNALLTDLNRLLQAGPRYDSQSFTKIRLSEQAEALLAQDPKSGEALMRLNRLLLSSAKAIEAFKEKYGLSMPIWIGKNMRMGVPVDSGAKLITLLLNRDLVVKVMPVDSDPEVLAQKVKQAIVSKH